MRIGWHIHPWGREDKHEKSKPVSIDEFLQLLETGLKEHGKLS